MAAPNLIPLYLYLGGPLPPPQYLYDYVLARQGIVKRIETRAVAAELLLAPIEAELIGLHLQPYPLRPFRLKLPRIPGRLLQAVLADAGHTMGLEVVYHFRFEPGQGWYVTRPDQSQGRTRVGWDEANQADIILELHSHHTMPAFFSETDDRDERGGRLYGVMGRLDTAQPQLVLRQGLYGHWLHNIPALTLFEDLGPFVDTYTGAANGHSVGFDGTGLIEPDDRAELQSRWSFAQLFRRRSS
jgi:PRTRC genetic system protein A